MFSHLLPVYVLPIHPSSPNSPPETFPPGLSYQLELLEQLPYCLSINFFKTNLLSTSHWSGRWFSVLWLYFYLSVPLLEHESSRTKSVSSFIRHISKHNILKSSMSCIDIGTGSWALSFRSHWLGTKFKAVESKERTWRQSPKDNPVKHNACLAMDEERREFRFLWSSEGSKDQIVLRSREHGS